MRYISSKNFLLTLLGISVLLIFFRFSTLIAFPDAHTLERDKIQKIYPGETFSQQFIANRDNLETIQLLLKGPGLKKTDTINLRIADETCADTLREGILETAFLNSDNLYLFSFPRIADSAEKKYCLLLTFQEKNHSSKYLQFFTTDKGDASPLLMNADTDDPMNGQSLSLRTVYRNDSLWQDLGELNDRISQYKPWFLKDIFIGTIAILFVVLSIALITLLITVKTEEKKD
jgi:hypothetical protein